MSDKPVVIKIPAVETWPITHLRNACKRNNVKGYTKMDKEQLVNAVKTIIADFDNNREMKK